MILMPFIRFSNQVIYERRWHMVSQIRRLCIEGIGGYEVSVEGYLSSGLPAFGKVGCLDQMGE